jgi:2-polyprenyl-3-methyl-5-hydroxy-6-metoxy-1,4-benzoquinol methylase
MSPANYYANINPELLAHIPLTARHVLEVGCGAGHFARAYRSRNPDARFRGVELFARAAQQAMQWMDSVTEGNIETDATLVGLDEARNGQPFDTLIFGDVLEHLLDPWGVLASLAQRCTADATCVVCVPNVSHWSLLQQQLRGRWDYADAGLLDRTHLRFFTLATVQEMLLRAGWHTTDVQARQLWPEKTAAAVKALAPAAQALGIDPAQMAQNVSAFQWVVRAVRRPAKPSVSAPLPSALSAPLYVAALGLKKAAGVTDVRIDQPLAALATLPGTRVVCGAQTLAIPKDWPAGVLVLQRNFLTDAATIAHVEARVAKGWVVVADMDDDPHRWAEFVTSNFYAYRAVHAVTVSTEPLAHLMRQWNPHVQVFPNAVFTLPEVAPSVPKQAGRIKVFFGALNREGDWAEVRLGILAAATQLQGEVEFVVVHDRAFHDALPPQCHKTFHPTLPHDQYMAALAGSDVALLPLADNPFNRLKSDLKFIECCAAQVVPVCSEVVYAARAEHRQIGVFATGADAWAQALLQLCSDPAEIHRRRALGLHYVKTQRMHNHQVAQRQAYYQGLLANRIALEAQRQQRLTQWP